MTDKEKVLNVLPIETEFTAHEISEKVYPKDVKTDTEGRTYNRSVNKVSEILKKCKYVQRIENGNYYVHRSMFNRFADKNFTIVRKGDSCTECAGSGCVRCDYTGKEL